MVLAPGKEAGTTDIVLEVQDRLPFHYGYEFDNFGSRYIDWQRHTATAEHNNLLGLDDKLSFKYQKGQNNFYNFYNFQYTVPMTESLDTGIYYLWSDTKLAKEFKALDVVGKSQLAGLFFSYVILNIPSVDFRFTGGFDYKSVLNYISGAKTSRDQTRVVKAGFDLDIQDKWGRTIITLEEDFGISAGDLHKKDPIGTRQGAGAEFNKLVGALYRLQPMPFSSTILWKNQFQATAYNLLAIEQFQIGGIANVRGYCPGEYSGDAGYTTSVEWSFPPYFMPKTTMVPLSKSTFYDATRFVAFYDLGYVHTKTIQTANDKNDRTVHGWGGGLRFSLPEDLIARLEFAYRFKNNVQFDDANLYMDFSKKF
ncbi:MAG: ShlB/FhaC/HecB family hemolysin secretion/activation protein [Candidatus Omnitrophica bacterium]|nr:ShlB/FhaC/HecB family hemolysin secretion/activation protein [Candidatus Omnitrophota bacterium]